MNILEGDNKFLTYNREIILLCGLSDCIYERSIVNILINFLTFNTIIFNILYIYTRIFSAVSVYINLVLRLRL